MIFANPKVVEDLGEYDTTCLSPDQLYRSLLWYEDEVEIGARDGILITDDFPLTEFPLWRYLFSGQEMWTPDVECRRN